MFRACSRILSGTHEHIQSLLQNSICVTRVRSEPVTQFHLCDTGTFRACHTIPSVWHWCMFSACSRILSVWHWGTFRAWSRIQSLCYVSMLRVCSRIPSGYAQSMFWDCLGDTWVSWSMLIRCIYMVFIMGFTSCSCPSALHITFLILPLQTCFGSVSNVQCHLKQKVTATWITCNVSCTSANDMYLLFIQGKAIPLQAWTGPEGSRKLRIPDFKTIGTWRW
jgi:hypothetical protein